jgi:voltage-gated potassium channel
MEEASMAQEVTSPEGTAAPEERWRVLDQLDDWLRVPMIVLSLAWLAIVIVELTHGASRLLEIFGTAIWVIFILEFALRITIAPNRLRFLKSNWLTVIALAVPALRLFRALRLLRAARALRGIRLVRIVGTANRSMKTLKSTLHRRRFGYVVGLTALVILLGAAGMLSFEPADEVAGGFTSYGDALWWTAMMVSTIGSAFWPLTVEGRLLCFLLSLYGLAVFGYITASFASFFVGRDAEEAAGPVAGRGDLAAIRDEIAALRRDLSPGASPPGR